MLANNEKLSDTISQKLEIKIKSGLECVFLEGYTCPRLTSLIALISSYTVSQIMWFFAGGILKTSTLRANAPLMQPSDDHRDVESFCPDFHVYKKMNIYKQ